MKVLMINVVCGIRSTGRICTDLADALTEQGHEVKIAYGRETVPEKYEKYAIRIGNDLDVKIHAVKARLFDASGFGSKRATVKFIEWVKEYDPDIIHLHNIHGYYINIEVLFAYLKTCGKKIIWTLHDCWAFTGHSALCDSVSCKKWKSGCFNCPVLFEYPKSFVDRSSKNWDKKRRIFNGVSSITIVTPSKWLAGLVRESFLSQYSVTVINNGIDITQFFPVNNTVKKELGIDDRFMIIAVASSWNNMKGLRDFFKLASVLDDSYRIVLVGVTKKQKKQLPQNIIGIVRTNSIQNLVEIYSAADVNVNLSYCDTYPTVNIEAAACGTPTITYRTGGGPEYVESSGGVIVDKGDIDSVVKALCNPIKVSFDKERDSSERSIKDYIEIYGIKA